VDTALIKRSVGEQGLNRLVIAGCSHREIRNTMEEMARGMGFNPTLIEYANIREQCAFVHQAYPELATEKAVALITMAVERARRLQPIRRGSQPVEKTGVVVGGGLAGMSAALRLAEQGYRVHLIERGKELGGNLRESFYTIKGSQPQVLLQELIKKVEGFPSIQRHFEAEVVGFERRNGELPDEDPRGGRRGDSGSRGPCPGQGGKEVLPRAYLYGEDSRVITQRDSWKR